MSAERRSTDVDTYVGRRIRQRRDATGLSQERLAELLGISFQQVQKYERGLNRVSASRLYQLCGVLDVLPGYFFDGLDLVRPAGVAEPTEPDQLSIASLLAQPGALDLLAEFARIARPARRKKLLEMARILADESDDD